MAREIRGKNILITGASSGIGRAAALELARRGARLGLAARREDRLQRLAGEVRDLGADAFWCAADVTDPHQVQHLEERTVQEFGVIDVLINNAGSGMRSSIEETTAEEYLELLRVNLLGPVQLIQAVLPHLKARRSGHIINVSSVAGTRALPESGAYSSAKFALNGMSEALRLELEPFGIDVSLVLPISTDTEFFRVASRKPGKNARPAGPVQPPERVARAIADCIRRPRPEVYTYLPARMLHVLNALWPGLMDFYTRKFLARRGDRE